ncbi:MAG: mandelate racemase/muconate lactonizing enzyme family protein [Myxococcota bacterium]
MIITSITPYVYEYDLPNPISDARNTITKRSCLLVKVKTDEGLVGWGEAASFANCGSLVADVIRFLEDRFVGQDPRFISRLYDTQYHLTQHFGRRGLVINALSGIDVALWDLQGKRAGLPVYQLLGASRDKIAFYFNSGYFIEGDHHAFLERTIEQSVERGAGAIKIKIGRHGFADDVWRVKRAREILGPERDLMVDANACLPARYLQRLDDVLSEHGVRWLEEPIPLQNRSVLIELRNKLRTPIAGYELEMTLLGYHQLLKDRVTHRHHGA